MLYPDYSNHPHYNHVQPQFFDKLWSFAYFGKYLLLSAWKHIVGLPFYPKYNKLSDIPGCSEFYRNGYAKFEIDARQVTDIKSELDNLLDPFLKQHNETPIEKRTIAQTVLIIPKKIYPQIYEKVLNSLPKRIKLLLSNLLNDYVLDELRIHHNLSSDSTAWNHESEQKFYTYYSPSWHVDTTINIVKINIYLSDVSIKNGPFCYIKSSHMMRGSIVNRIIRLAHNLAKTDCFDTKNRARFSSLPTWAKKKNLIGTEFTERNEEFDEMLNNSVEFTGQAGTAIIFDGLGIHKGGVVEEGKCWRYY